MTTYWTFSLDGELSDSEFYNSEDCLKALDDHFAEKIQQDENLKDGDTRICAAEIIRFRYDDNEERDVIYSKEVLVEYEHYHGDIAEHGTY